MKRALFFLILILSVSEVFSSTDSLYHSAITNYEEGRFEEALQQYREVLNRGVESPLLYYNMGNAAYRSNHLGYAVLYFEKALKMDPGFEDAQYNLTFVNQFRSDKFEQVPELFIRRWFSGAINGLSHQVWGIISLVTFLFLLCGILIYIFARRLIFKKSGFFTALFTLLIFTFSLLAGFRQHQKIVRPDEGIIIAPTVTVKSSPSDTGNDLFILHEGTKIEIDEEVSGWRSIRIIDGREGWIPEENFSAI